MEIHRARTCERCKQVIPLNKVRLYPKDKEGNLLVCESCCDELKKAGKGTLVSSKIKPLPPPDYVSYFCSRCNYNFKIDLSKTGITTNLNCPYCGRLDRLEKRRK
ncbi:MAG: hypothetical protein ABIG93_02155 [archaeon]|nr:hypothetical protein [Nanoarchaeota archaeon]